MRPASMAGSRRSKIEALREREALKVRAHARAERCRATARSSRSYPSQEHRGRLQSMLSQKLVHKYGVTCVRGRAPSCFVSSVSSSLSLSLFSALFSHSSLLSFLSLFAVSPPLPKSRRRMIVSSLLAASLSLSLFDLSLSAEAAKLCTDRW